MERESACTIIREMRNAWGPRILKLVKHRNCDKGGGPESPSNYSFRALQIHNLRPEYFGNKGNQRSACGAHLPISHKHGLAFCWCFHYSWIPLQSDIYVVASSTSKSIDIIYIEYVMIKRFRVEYLYMLEFLANMSTNSRHWTSTRLR